MATVGAVEESPIDRFRAVMETNYFGALRCIKAVLPGMRERRSGCIVNVTSIGGRIAMAACAAYTASKFALEALGEVLAQEVRGFNIRVAMVEPGIVDTAMAGRVAATPASSRYPQVGRMSAMVRASLAEPTPPAVVAEKVREIIESGTWQLRHPVGLDAQSFLDWRAAMSDEAWIEFGALDDESWRRRMQADWGMNLPPQT
jgi:NAD(P)-dependent dehydrogenase (short-subunit alcohol dehydrogenase family)